MYNEYINIEIERLLDLEKKYRSQLLIVLVANVEGETKLYDDYENTSVLSEYYTLDEYEKLSLNYKKMGYEVISYFNETDFMAAILNQHIHAGNKKILVINSAQTGTYVGRKSLIPAFCEHHKIMHTGSNPYVVSLCRDKFHSNAILHSFTSNYMETYLYTSTGWLGNKYPQNGTKVIAKLNGESASIGLGSENIFLYSSNMDYYLHELLQQYKQSIVVQPFIAGYEIELPVIAGKSSLPLIAAGIKMGNSEMLGDNFLDYNARLYHLYSFYNFNDFSPILTFQAQKDAVQAVKILGISGFGRIDFRITPTGTLYISDIATNPHITEDSSYAFAFRELGFSYSELLAAQVGVTLLYYSLE